MASEQTALQMLRQIYDHAGISYQINPITDSQRADLAKMLLMYNEGSGVIRPDTHVLTVTTEGNSRTSGMDGALYYFDARGDLYHVHYGY